MYVCFMVSGVIDLAGWWGILPEGAEKAYLSLAFAGEALLMGLHEKHEPLVRRRGRDSTCEVTLKLLDAGRGGGDGWVRLPQ